MKEKHILEAWTCSSPVSVGDDDGVTVWWPFVVPGLVYDCKVLGVEVRKKTQKRLLLLI
jgi:hypothetical protein